MTSWLTSFVLAVGFVGVRNTAAGSKGGSLFEDLGREDCGCTGRAGTGVSKSDIRGTARKYVLDCTFVVEVVAGIGGFLICTKVAVRIGPEAPARLSSIGEVNVFCCLLLETVSASSVSFETSFEVALPLLSAGALVRWRLVVGTASVANVVSVNPRLDAA